MIGTKIKPVVLFFHGNAGNISHRIQKIRIFRQLGISVFLFDYRGYGKSQGRPTERGTYIDGRAAIKTVLEDLGIQKNQLVYYGESLGCAVALQMALEVEPSAVILDSAFTSTVEMGRLMLPFLPLRWIVRYRYDNLSKIKLLKSPILLLHSPTDDIIPFEMATRLYHNAQEPKLLLKTLGDHNSGFLDTPYWGKGIRDFLSKHL